jgi:hypothetical protein
MLSLLHVLAKQTTLVLIYNAFYIYIHYPETGGHTVVQLVEALRYKPEGHGIDSRWCHWNFSLT